MSRRRMGTIAATLAAIVLTAATASARPLYFDTFTGLYGFSSGDDLYACGVCHRRWEGTGGRNPYGEAVEQQLAVVVHVPVERRHVVDRVTGGVAEERPRATCQVQRARCNVETCLVQRAACNVLGAT